MRTVNLISSDAIRAAMDAFEDAELASSEDFDVDTEWLNGEDTEVIISVEIERVGISLNNTSVDHEVDEFRDMVAQEKSDMHHWRYNR